jgi:hypothetical protein
MDRVHSELRRPGIGPPREELSGTLSWEKVPDTPFVAHFRFEDFDFLESAHPAGPTNCIAAWSGSGNVYCLGPAAWALVRAKSFADWRRLWKSDADSAEGDPPTYDPQQWRLLSGQPKKDDGKDYGADVDRVARPPAPDGKE